MLMQTANANDPRRRLISTVSKVRHTGLSSPNFLDVPYFTCLEKRRSERYLTAVLNPLEIPS